MLGSGSNLHLHSNQSCCSQILNSLHYSINSWRVSFNICFKTGILAKNSLNFCLKKIFLFHFLFFFYYSWFIMFLQFLFYSKVIQSHTVPCAVHCRAPLPVHSKYNSLHPQTPDCPSIPLPPPSPQEPQVCLLGRDLFLFCKKDHLCHILDCTNKWYHMIFVFFFLAYFT